MVIMPDDREDGYNRREDLRRQRGKSSEELMDELLQEQRDKAVAKGTDYFRGSKHVTVNPLGGVPIVAGLKRKDIETKEEESDPEEDPHVKKARKEAAEQVAKKEQYISKYSISNLDDSKNSKNNDIEQ